MKHAAELAAPSAHLGLALLVGACSRGGDLPSTRVQFEVAGSTVHEGGAPLAVRVVLLTSQAALEREVSVQVVDLGGGSATSGLDFAAPGEQEVRFPAGSRNGEVRSVALTALDDDRAEGPDETVRLALVQPLGVALGSRSTHTVAIEDADFATLQFESAASSTADEAAAVFVIPLVVTLPPGVTLDGPIGVRVYDAGTGSATSNQDYTRFAARSVAIPPGAAGGTLLPIDVDVIPDLLAEGAETVVLALDQPGQGTRVGLTATHTLTIRDDDIGPGADLAVTRSPDTNPLALSSGAQLDLGSQVNTGGATGGIVVRVASEGSGPLSLALPVVSGADERDFDLEFLPLAASGAAPSESAVALPSPLLASESQGGPGLALALDPELLGQLAAHDAATVLGFPAGGEQLALELVRRRSPWSADAQLVVDGEPLEGGPAALLGDLQLWSGGVAGEAGSRVFLALSSRGAQGWIRRANAAVPTQHLLSGGGALRELDDLQLAALGAREPLDFCAEAPPVGPGAPRGASAPTEAAPGPWPTCRMALETDYQLFARFGDAGALVQYVTALVAAASARYESDVGTRLEIARLGVHSQSDDGWIVPDMQGSTSQLLDEFQHSWGAAWGGSWPTPANLAHFLSGANLGGGVAYLGVLCDQNWGFAVSANLNRAIDWPNWTGLAGPLTWDFVVFTHETGHNFGVEHTHAYCPPLDRCFSNCTPGTQCQQGTLMSYCHLCGGLSNVDLRFHPCNANRMRAEAQASCLGEIVLQPGESLDWLVRFEPWTGLGTRRAKISFAHAAGNAPSPFDVELVGASIP